MVNMRVEGGYDVRSEETVFLTPEPHSVHLFDKEGRPVSTKGANA